MQILVRIPQWWRFVIYTIWIAASALTKDYQHLMTGQTAVSMLFTSVNIMAPIMFNTVVATMGGAGWACPRTNKFRPA